MRGDNEDEKGGEEREEVWWKLVGVSTDELSHACDLLLGVYERTKFREGLDAGAEQKDNEDHRSASDGERKVLSRPSLLD